MRKIALATLGALCLLVATLYYAVPSSFHEPLLRLNRGISNLGEHQIDVAEHRVHYLDNGVQSPPAGVADGAHIPIILLHGIFAEKDHWVDFARALPGGTRILVPDLPGFGESSRLPGHAYDYASQTQRLVQWLDALGIRRMHLAGNSMGGTLAAMVALAHPGRVASVAFIGGPHGLRSPTPSPMDRRIDAGERPLVARDDAEFDAMMALVFEQRPFLPYPILQAARRSAVDRAASNEQLWDAQLQDRYQLQAVLPALQAPVLALWGEQDRAFDVSGTQTLATLLPAARIERLPGVGHLPMMETPADTARRFAAFLAQLPASAGQASEKSAKMRVTAGPSGVSSY